jgi:thiol:disulfide interchange protein DsbA
MRRILFLMTSLLLLAPWSASAEIRGNYTLVGTAPQPHSVERVRFEEFMNFGCPHCNNLRNASKAFREEYRDRVEFVDIPIVFRGQDDSPLRLYHVANKAGKGELIKNALFDASFKHSVNVFDPGIVNYLARSTGLGAQYAAERDQEWVNALIQEGMRKADTYGVTGTPTVVLQGSLKMDIGQYGGMDGFVKQLPETLSDLLK